MKNMLWLDVTDECLDRRGVGYVQSVNSAAGGPATRGGMHFKTKRRKPLHQMRADKSRASGHQRLMQSIYHIGSIHRAQHRRCPTHPRKDREGIANRDSERAPHSPLEW